MSFNYALIATWIACSLNAEIFGQNGKDVFVFVIVPEFQFFDVEREVSGGVRSSANHSVLTAKGDQIRGLANGMA